MANRGPNVQYTLNSATGEAYSASALNELCRIIIVNNTELSGLANIWSNPENWQNPSYRIGQRTIGPEFPPPIVDKEKFTLNVANAIVNNSNVLVEQIKALQADYPIDYVPNFVTGDNISGVNVNKIINNLHSISVFLDAHNGWWNTGQMSDRPTDICIRSCQISCQQACQISCQGCNGHSWSQHCGSMAKV